MPDVLNPRIVACFRGFSALAALAALLLGGLVLVGWRVGSATLVTVAPGLAAMSPVTAMAFIVAGLSLSARRLRRPRLAAAAALLLMAMGAAVLLGYATAGHDVLNPYLGNRLSDAPDSLQGLTAPATAAGFLLLGVALFALGASGRQAERVIVVCCVSGLLLSGLALLGYAYGVEGLYATAAYRTTALHTAAGLFVLFGACILNDPERGWAAIIASGRPNGAPMRAQLLLTTLLPFAAGLFLLRAIRAGELAPSLAMAILVASTTIPIVLRILLDGRMLDTLDMQRRQAVAALRRLNEELEERVRQRTENLAASEARLRTYFDHAPEGLAVFMLADDGTFVFDSANPAFRTMYSLGGQDVAGRALREFIAEAVDQDMQAHLVACLRSGQVQRYTARRPLGGRDRTIDVVIAPVPAAAPAGPRLIVGSTRDITDAELRDEQLRQAQKMEAIGQLTGGLAHDFNNLLAGIIGSLELLETRVAQGRVKDLDRYIGAAQGAAKRAAALTHRLLAFSRRQTLDPQPTNVNRLVAGMEEMIRRTVGPAVAVEVVAAGGLWAALLDPNQLENALLNLCINARDAMPDGGRITIESANKWLDERAAAERDVPPGQYVTLCVSDNGTGMSAEIVARAFDPFFTTKPLGTGTGLGLSMVYGFVRQSGGQARIYSEPGQGTTICLYLPRHFGETDMPELPAKVLAAPEAEAHRTVLVVDDEPTVRMLVTEVLDDLGYAAIEVADGAAGLRVLQSDVRIDLLVTDVGLPGGLNGRQVADAARLARPGLNVLFITGYAENAVLSHGHLEPGMHVLTKPFAMEALAARIRELIAGR